MVDLKYDLIRPLRSAVMATIIATRHGMIYTPRSFSQMCISEIRTLLMDDSRQNYC